MTNSTDEGRALRKDAAQNRALVVEAARQLFEEVGLDVSYDDIGRRAGVGVATVYRRFPDREDLIFTLFSQRVEDLAAFGDRALQATDALAGLRSFVEEVMDRQVRDRGFAQVLTLGPAYGDKIATCGDLLRPKLAALVARAHDTGQLRADIGTNDFEMFMMMLGWFGDPSRSQSWRRYAAIFFDGATASGAAATPLPVNEPADQELRRLADYLRTPRVD